MKKFLVLADSSCDIPEEHLLNMDIEILSFTIQVDGVEYSEREELTPDKFYEILDNSENPPTTSQITAITFLDKFIECDKKGIEEVLYISINSTGSATNSCAQQARAMFLDEYPDSEMRIAVVDSHTYSMAYGIFVLSAAKKLKNGAEMSDVVDYLLERFKTVEVILGVHSLKTIKKSGRISAAAAFAGELMGLRPIISIISGETKVVQKVRGDVKVLPALVAYAKENKGEQTPYIIAGTKGFEDKDGDVKEITKLCTKTFGYPPELAFKLGAAVTSNTGTDAVAIIYMTS